MPGSPYQRGLRCKLCGKPRHDQAKHVCAECVDRWNATNPYATSHSAGGRVGVIEDWRTLENGVRVRTVGWA